MPIANALNINFTANQLIYASSGTVLAGLATANNSVLITSAGGVPSLSTTLPVAVQSNITTVGTITSGVWNGTIISPIYGGTGVNNGVNTITLGGNIATGGAITTAGALTLAGAFGATFNFTGATNVTFPTSGTLATTAGSVASVTGTANQIDSTGGVNPVLSISSTMIFPGTVTLNADPLTALQAATKQYVDSFASGITVKTPAVAATTVDLNAVYNNGAAGVGATLENAGVQAAFSVDGVTPGAASRILVKNQTNLFENGIYEVTDVGSGATNWILTRTADYDQPAEIQPGNLIPVTMGTVNANTSWLQTDTVTNIGVDSIQFSQFTYGANWRGNPIELAYGGTSASLVASNGGIFYSTAAAGAILAGTATANQMLQSGATAAPSWSTTTWPATSTINRLLYSSAANVISELATANNGLLVTSNTGVPSILGGPGTTGQILQSNAAAAPSFSTASYPSTTTINRVLYSSANNVINELATANNGVLVTDGTGVPSISSTLPAAVQGNITAVGALAGGSLAAGFTPVNVAQGGTGNSSLTAYAVLCGGTAGTNPIQSIASVGTAGQVLTSNGAGALPTMQNLGAIALTVNSLCDFRLTLTTGVPVTTTNVTAATTLYWTPYKGNYVALYDGANWLNYTSAQLSIAVPATTSTMYDVFVGLAAGVPALSTIAWTNITTRATAIVLQDGVYVQSGDTTKRYVGSFATSTVSGQTNDSLLQRLVFNYYNPVKRSLAVTESTVTWNYTLLAFQQVNASAANQVLVVTGVSENVFAARALGIAGNTGATPFVSSGIGINSTTVNSAITHGMLIPNNNTVGAQRAQVHAHYSGYLPVGLNTIAWLESSTTGGTTTWTGDTQNLQSGMTCEAVM